MRMLMNDFYIIENIQQQEESVSCKVIFNSDHDIFKGHFPGHPVVPGVCMMEIVKELMQLQIGKPIWLHNAGNVKFLQLITPDVQPTVHIHWKKNESGYNVNASFNTDTTLFKLNGNYKTNS
jgi:3-hydroxyacyl-[acyl-carrier-protein] dehydratase